MKKLLLLSALAVGSVAGGAAFGGSVHAQTSVTADQLIGAQTRVTLGTALNYLGGALGTLRGELNSGQGPANDQAVSGNLTQIGSILLGLRSTLLAFDSRAQALALGNSTTPGLPNTGGGGAAR